MVRHIKILSFASVHFAYDLADHLRNECKNPRKINLDHVADVSPEVAWAKLERAVAERDVDDAKEAVDEYVKALGGATTYRELQEAMFAQNISLFFMPLERPLQKVYTNMDLHGNLGKKYSISYRFSEKPRRAIEAPLFPNSREELLARLDDAGKTVPDGRTLCRNYEELGHIAKSCPQEKRMGPEQPKISCSNCGEDGHRIRNCMRLKHCKALMSR